LRDDEGRTLQFARAHADQQSALRMVRGGAAQLKS
jgi:hypothetical protein